MSGERVTILGGGLSGLTTAFNLTAPEQGGRFDVTVYQLGWRLGGKCATGRNEAHGDRIQEHGLHVFMGQYQNAFRMVQALYAEAAHPPFPDWRQGFTMQPSTSLMEQVDGAWVPWVLDLPVFPGTPGIDPPPTLIQRMIQFLEWVGEHMLGVHAAVFEPAATTAPAPPWWRQAFDDLVDWTLDDIAHLGRDLVRVAVACLNALDPGWATHDPATHHRLAGVFDRLRDWMTRRVAGLLDGNSDLRHFFIIADMGLVSLIGGLRDGLLLDPAANLERVNKLDYKAWLRLHGAAGITVESALVRSTYDLVFAYPDGDWHGDGNVEAGTLFVSLMNTALYQGSFVWQFNTATGDLVMAPMYEVLKARGVKFEFFCRVDALNPDPTGSFIDSVQIGRQVALNAPEYLPLRTLPSGQRVWPDRPLYDQIVDGQRLAAANANLESWWTNWADAGRPLTLVAGQDYDRLVLAIPPAAHPVICAKLIAHKPAWAAMVPAVQTVATQSLQTWMTVDEAGLGWTDPTLIGAYDVTNLNSWADISAVLKTETWPAAAGVVSEQIACGPLPCPQFPPPRSEIGYPATIQAQADAAAAAYLDNDAHVFWPNRFPAGGRPHPGTLVSQYSRINIDPSERYTLTVADSTRARLGTAESGYANLHLTGDWIRNGQNLGSFEATTISGILCAQAISGEPLAVSGVDALALTGGATGLPRFVENHGQVTFPGPISLADTTMWAFLLDADYARLQDYCQRTFDIPSGGAVRVLPLSAHVLMTVVDIAQGRFTDAPDMGWSKERELTFWIPAVRVEERDGTMVATHFDMVMPYLVLDNPVAIASGREVFGYWKQHGWVTVPCDPGNDAGALNVDLFATKIFGAASQEQRERLLSLTPASSTPADWLAGLSFGDAAAALHRRVAPGIAKWQPGLAFGLDLLGDIFDARVPQLFLKQFRDIADGRFACYQAVTESMATVTGFEAWPHLIEFDMRLEALASSPVAQDLGIAPQQRITGVRLTYDMRIDPGRVLWRA